MMAPSGHLPAPQRSCEGILCALLNGAGLQRFCPLSFQLDCQFFGGHTASYVSLFCITGVCVCMFIFFIINILVGNLFSLSKVTNRDKQK